MTKGQSLQHHPHTLVGAVRSHQSLLREVVMSAFSLSSNAYQARFAFIETLSGEFISRTGMGVYAYLDPGAVEQLFERYQTLDVPVLAYARQCVRKILS